MSRLVIPASAIAAALALFIAAPAAAQCPADDTNGVADNQRDDLDYLYVMTGGKFPTGNIPNGSSASGGTFRYLVDDPDWGYPTGSWRRDGWFPQNAGLALTLENDGAIVYDNNGIEDGSHGGFYDSSGVTTPGPGLYRGYCMPNNWDFTYATYFRLLVPTTFDTMIGYFDGDGYAGGWDPLSPEVVYAMNVWTAGQVGTTSGGNPIFDPLCATHAGDVLALQSVDVDWSASYTGVDREFPPSFGRPPDPIWRVEFSPAAPITLPAGHYFFNLAALVQLTAGVDVRPNNLLNQVNTNANQLVSIAILSSASLDAPAEVDMASVVFRGASPLLTVFDHEDVNGDSLLDLVLRFRARSMDKPTPEECDNPGMKHLLTGSTFAGKSFVGSDRVTFTGPDCD